MPKERIAVQSSYRMSDEDTWKREVNALVKLNSLYSLKKTVIITYDAETTIEQNGLVIEVKPTWK